MALSFGVLFGVILILVSLIRTFGLPWTSNRGSYGEQQALVMRQLSLVADLKKDQLLIWLEERKRDAELLARNALVVSSLEKLLEVVHGGAGPSRSKDELRSDLLQQHSAKTLTEALMMVSGPGSVYEKAQVVDLNEGLVWLPPTPRTSVPGFPTTGFWTPPGIQATNRLLWPPHLL